MHSVIFREREVEKCFQENRKVVLVVCFSCVL